MAWREVICDRMIEGDLVGFVVPKLDDSYAFTYYVFHAQDKTILALGEESSWRVAKQRVDEEINRKERHD